MYTKVLKYRIIATFSIPCEQNNMIFSFDSIKSTKALKKQISNQIEEDGCMDLKSYFLPKTTHDMCSGTFPLAEC